jgi:hypothetical protein
MSMMESLVSKKGGTFHNRRTSYNFDIETALTEEQFEGSKIKKDQNDAITEIQKLIEYNPDLVMKEPDKGAHTIQVRFTAIPITLCTLIINDISFTDPYLYSKLDQKKGKSLLFFYPVLKISKENYLNLFSSIANNFDYYWANELTLFCQDATAYKGDNPEGLLELKKPDEIVALNHRVKRTEYHLKIPASNPATINTWTQNIITRFKKSTRLPVSTGHTPVSLPPGINKSQQEELEKTDGLIPENKGASRIEFGYDDENKKYFCSLEINGITMGYSGKRNENRKKSPHLCGIHIGFKILVHYALLKMDGKQGVMFEEKHITDLYQARKAVKMTLLNNAIKVTDPHDINTDFIRKTIIDIGEGSTTFKIEEINCPPEVRKKLELLIYANDLKIKNEDSELYYAHNGEKYITTK